MIYFASRKASAFRHPVRDTTLRNADSIPLHHTIISFAALPAAEGELFACCRMALVRAIYLMPEISRFLGIRVEMFYDDHLPPHFHARHEGERAAFMLDGSLMEGSFSNQAHRLIREWAALHPKELDENWQLAEKHLPLKRIPPLS